MAMGILKLFLSLSILNPTDLVGFAKTSKSAGRAPIWKSHQTSPKSDFLHFTFYFIYPRYKAKNF